MTVSDRSGYVFVWCAQVFFLQSEDYPGSLSDPADHSRLTENVARAFCVALLPHLKLLKEDGMAKLGLRVTLDSDQVGSDRNSGQMENSERRREQSWPEGEGIRANRLALCNTSVGKRVLNLFAVSGGLSGRKQRPASAATVPERPGQRSDPRHPRRRMPAEWGSRGHGVDLLHFRNHLVGTPPSSFLKFVFHPSARTSAASSTDTCKDAKPVQAEEHSSCGTYASSHRRGPVSLPCSFEVLQAAEGKLRGPRGACW